MDALPMRFLANADLQRAEASLHPDLRGDDLIDGRSAGAPSAVNRTGNQATHRFVMAIAGARDARRRIIQTADHVNVFLKRRERRKTGCERVTCAGLGWYPIPFRDTVTVEPQYEARWNRRSSRGIRGPVTVEHGKQRRQAHADGRAREACATQKPSSRNGPGRHKFTLPKTSLITS